MLLPLLLIVLAGGAAAIIAYGTSPASGLELIILSRRLQWPLIAFCLLCCVILIGLVISNRRRAWWLIGLAPIMALFVHRFGPWQQRQYVVEFASSNPPTLPADDAWVVGVVFGDDAYALPYSSLYTAPVVFVTDYDKRMLLMWSPRANHGTAYSVMHELKPRDLEIVSTPADSVLVYDKRLGQFVVGVTGLTPRGQMPVGFIKPVNEIVKTTWAAWRKVHPETKVMQMYRSRSAPSGPVLPSDVGKLIEGVKAETRIALVPATQPVAIATDDIGAKPLNTAAGPLRLLVIRDPAGKRLRVFDRNVKEDLVVTFTAKTNRRIRDAVLFDSDTGSLWTIDGKAVDGNLKGSQLRELSIEPDLYWGVMKHWYPRLILAKPAS